MINWCKISIKVTKTMLKQIWHWTRNQTTGTFTIIGSSSTITIGINRTERQSYKMCHLWTKSRDHRVRSTWSKLIKVTYNKLPNSKYFKCHPKQIQLFHVQSTMRKLTVLSFWTWTSCLPIAKTISFLSKNRFLRKLINKTFLRTR